jgi:hypothetical protein
MIKNYIGVHVKYPLFLSEFNESLLFLTGFREILKISNIMKIPPLGAELFNADGRTDRHNKADSHFSKFYEHA